MENCKRKKTPLKNQFPGVNSTGEVIIPPSSLTQELRETSKRNLNGLLTPIRLKRTLQTRYTNVLI